jgi:hypothetical protein
MSGLAAVDRKLEGGASAGLLPSLGKEKWDVLDEFLDVCVFGKTLSIKTRLDLHACIERIRRFLFDLGCDSV